MTKPIKKPMTFDEYLASLSGKERATLQTIRQTIHKIVPQAVEGISYGMQAFLLDGKPLAALAANTHHCSYFPMSGAIVPALARELKSYDTSKGTVRFDADKPLSTTLVRKLVKARLAEIEGQSSSKVASNRASKQTDPAVVAFLKALKHPLKKEIEAVRKIILGVSASIQEGIKWNVPSFRTTDYFATVFLRSTETVQLIFHTGAKVKATATTGLKIDDPAGLLKWLAKDRCMVTLGKGREIQAKRKAFEAIVRQWIESLQ
ncbi:MAG TPA: DUF1801 domain-containing protein [Gemmatales bacterium]|nr:DUF1801 domain-containing protein [Gemmatales bacterium]